MYNHICHPVRLARCTVATRFMHDRDSASVCLFSIRENAMTFQSAPEIASIAIHGSSNGKQIANILHAKFPGPYGASDITFLAASLITYVNTNYPPLMSPNLLFDDITVTGLNAINDFQAVSTLGASAGTAAGDPLPANNSLVCTLRSILTGRSARGRIFSFPTGTTNLNASGGDLYDTSYVTALETFWVGVSGAINGSGWTHCILSRITGSAPRAVGIGFTVTSITVRNATADSQRRRLPKGH